MFPVNIATFLIKNTYFKKHLRTAASVLAPSPIPGGSSLIQVVSICSGWFRVVLARSRWFLVLVCTDFSNRFYILPTENYYTQKNDFYLEGDTNRLFHCKKCVQVSNVQVSNVYEVSLRIQSECRKIRTRKNSVSGHFSRSVCMYE